MKRRYYTLAGDRFDIDTLTTDEVATIVDLETDAQRKPDGGVASDEEYLNRARKLIREKFPTFGASNRALSGAVGSVFRDLWYRRQLSRVDDKGSPEAKRLLRNIRAHPARVIHDVFLDSDISQADFARQIGVSPSVMSRLVSLFSATNAEPEEPLSTTTLVAVLSRLGVAARSLYIDEPTSVRSPEGIAAPLTFRERLLLTAVVEGIREIKDDDSAENLVDQLTLLFNAVTVQFIDSIVKSVLRVLGRGEWASEECAHLEISKVLASTESEKLLTSTKNSRSERLARQWKEEKWAGVAVAGTLTTTADTTGPSSSPVRQPCRFGV
jgi:hypothetical protein